MYMKLVIYSTCQGSGLAHYLKHYLKDYKIKVFHNYKLVLKQNKDWLKEFRNWLKETKIFIYQEMPSKWKEYSTDLSVKNNLLTYLPKDCIKIVIPYVYAEWFWGLGKIRLRDGTANFNKADIETQKLKKYINKEIIINLKNSGNDLKKILKLYDENKIDFKYNDRKIEGINILKEKEKTSDVKISDFILKNYKKKKLFYTQNHPTHIILEEMSKQILNILKINHIDFENYFKNKKYILEHGHSLIYSKYDKKFHNFDYFVETNDKYIKKLIKQIYNYF